MASARRAHRRIIRRPLSFGLVAATLAAGLTGIVATPSLAAPHASIAQVKARVDALGEQVARLSEQSNAANIQLATARAKEAALRDRLGRAQAHLAQVQEQLGQFASAAYRSGGVSDGLMNLLTSSNPSVFLGRSNTLDAISQRHAETINEAVSARHQVADAEAQAQQLVAQVSATQRALSAQKAQIQRLLAAQQAELDRLQSAARAAYLAQQSAYADRMASLRGSYNGPASGRAGVAVRFAYAQLGKPYQWGASGPNSYDCSGLTMAAWAAAGVSLPHYTGSQQQDTRPVSRADLQPGDLIFFGSPPYHVGLYIGNGRMIEAPHSGAVVRIASIDRSSYSGAGRP